jgi:hypothetical protein
MGRDPDSGQFEWVNAWAEIGRGAERPPKWDPAVPAMPRAAPTTPDDQLMRDIAEIERARDALAALPLSSPVSTSIRGSFAARHTQAFTLAPARTSVPVPAMVGGVLALVMLTVFGAAAAMTKLAR